MLQLASGTDTTGAGNPGQSCCCILTSSPDATLCSDMRNLDERHLGRLQQSHLQPFNILNLVFRRLTSQVSKRTMKHACLLAFSSVIRYSRPTIGASRSTAMSVSYEVLYSTQLQKKHNRRKYADGKLTIVDKTVTLYDEDGVELAREKQPGAVNLQVRSQVAAAPGTLYNSATLTSDLMHVNHVQRHLRAVCRSACRRSPALRATYWPLRAEQDRQTVAQSLQCCQSCTQRQPHTARRCMMLTM